MTYFMTNLEEAGKLTAPTPARVMLVDDHPIMRDGLQEVLERSGEFEVVGQAGDGVAAVEAAQSLQPDVIIMDVLMPLKNGIDACREIMYLLPDTRVLMLTASTEEHAVIEAIAAGATGYLQKFSGKEQLLAAVRGVAAGQYLVPNDAMRRVFTTLRAMSMQVVPPPERLTTREREILTLFAQGLSYAEIAEARGNRPLTIRNAIYGIQENWGPNRNRTSWCGPCETACWTRTNNHARWVPLIKQGRGSVPGLVFGVPVQAAYLSTTYP